MFAVKPRCPKCQSSNTERHCEKSKNCLWRICRKCIPGTPHINAEFVFSITNPRHFIRDRMPNLDK